MKNCIKGLLIFLLSVTLVNCTAQHKKKNKAKLEQGFIEMKKTLCYGRCPVYDIKITSDGKAVFEGKKNVTKLGQYGKKLSSEETHKLFDAFNKADFWKFQEEYKGKVPDVPSTILTYNYEGKTKTITAQWDVPEELKNLSMLLEEIANSDGWTKVEK